MVGRIFDAQVTILEHKSIICAGYSAVMHIYCVAEEVQAKVSCYGFFVFVCCLTFPLTFFPLKF